MKLSRQEAILRVIRDKEIETQKELLQCLREMGVHATQATISRDIRELKLSKMLSPSGKYRYELSSKPEMTTPKFNGALTESITRVDAAGNLLVVKTYPGMASAVATCIDSLSMPEIIGCVAGDDAILVVTLDEASAKDICTRLRQMIRSL